MNEPYALTRELPGLEYEAAIRRVSELLAERGFGILTEIDVKATLKKKLGVDFGRYLILGACNPSLAFQALSTEPEIGVLLPCNVIVRERERGGSVVSAFNPVAGFSLVGRKDLEPIAQRVRELMTEVLEALS